MPSGLCARGWCFTAATGSHQDVMRNLVGEEVWGEEGEPLKVPLPWRRSWAKQDFHRWTNKRWGGCLTASLLEAQQLPPNCWDLLLWTVGEGNTNQHLVVMSDVEHKSFLMGLVVPLCGSVAKEISITVGRKLQLFCTFTKIFFLCESTSKLGMLSVTCFCLNMFSCLVDFHESVNSACSESSVFNTPSFGKCEDKGKK